MLFDFQTQLIFQKMLITCTLDVLFFNVFDPVQCNMFKDLIIVKCFYISLYLWSKYSPSHNECCLTESAGCSSNSNSRHV